MSSPSPKKAELAATSLTAAEGIPESLRRCRPALGTLVDIHVAGLSAPRLDRALAAAFREIGRCEQALSAHRGDNDLARLRAARPGATLAVDIRLAVVLRRAAALARASGGVFDPRRRAPRGSPPFAGCFRLLPRRRLRLLAPLDLDLGGIAKGHALDRAHAVLRRAGVPRFFLNAGGDLRLHGLATRLVLRPPAGRGPFRELGTLRGGAAATSAQTFGPRLRDPRGAAAVHGQSFTVLAPVAVLADGLTKIAALAPPALAARVLARHRAHAALVGPRGRVRWLPSPPPAELFSPVV